MINTNTNATTPNVEPNAMPEDAPSPVRLREESQIFPSPTRIRTVASVNCQLVLRNWNGSNPGCQLRNKNKAPMAISKIGITRDVLGFRSSRSIADLQPFAERAASTARTFNTAGRKYSPDF